MTLTFQAYDASRCDYPQPLVPVLPALTLQGLGRSVDADFSSVFASPEEQLFTRARYAIFHALRVCGATEQHSVMVPAYHCRTMLDPVVHAGCQVVLFALNLDLSVKLGALEAAWATASHPVKALLLPHYFGFAQDMAPVLEFCQSRGVVLIEDCCHAYFGRAQGRVMGAWGDFAVSSPSKFFACEDGGQLVTRRARTPAPLAPRSAVQELRSVFHVAQGAWGQVRRRFLMHRRLQALPEQFSAVQARFAQPATFTQERSGAEVSVHYEPSEAVVSAPVSSRWWMRASSVQHLCARRRSNFLALLKGVKQLPHCRPLFAELPPGVVPYMFALLIDQPEHRFHWLKHLGVPLYRWDELAQAPGQRPCAVSAHYRLHLVHLPCHQALRSADIAWLLKALELVMNIPIDRQVPRP
jgi:perosamine synthetase